MPTQPFQHDYLDYSTEAELLNKAFPCRAWEGEERVTVTDTTIRAGVRAIARYRLVW